jgi:hypothetical protein
MLLTDGRVIILVGVSTAQSGNVVAAETPKRLVVQRIIWE